MVAPGGSSGIYGTDHTFDIDSVGQGCLRAGFTLCSEGSIDLQLETLTFVANQLDDMSWEIDPAPPD